MKIKKIDKLPQIGDIVDKEVLNGVTTYYRSVESIVPCREWDIQPANPSDDLYAIHYIEAEFFIHGWDERPCVEYVEVVHS